MGLSAAFHLRRADPALAVTVLERARIGSAASGASAAGVRAMGRDPAERRLALESLGRWPGLDRELEGETRIPARRRASRGARPQDVGGRAGLGRRAARRRRASRNRRRGRRATSGAGHRGRLSRRRLLPHRRPGRGHGHGGGLRRGRPPSRSAHGRGRGREEAGGRARTRRGRRAQRRRSAAVRRRHRDGRSLDSFPPGRPRRATPPADAAAPDVADRARAEIAGAGRGRFRQEAELEAARRRRLPDRRRLAGTRRGPRGESLGSAR